MTAGSGGRVYDAGLGHSTLNENGGCRDVPPREGGIEVLDRLNVP
jgi:hypothetical protein